MSALPFLAAALLAVAALLPPEIHPAGRLLVHLIAAAAALALAWSGVGRPPGARTGILVFVAPALASLLLASGGRARGLDEAAAFAAFGIAVLLGRRLAREGTGRNVVMTIVAVLGTIAAVQAVAQRHWAYPRAAAALRASDAAEADAYLVRLDQGRPAGPFSLPAALGGFLALSLPLTLAARRRASGTAARAAATAALAVQGYALLLTRSIGGLLAAVVALGLAAAASRPALRRRATIAAVVVFAAVALLFVYGRRAEIGARPGGDPVTLRLGNWEAAMRMVLDHPVLGVGPGRFPVFYPRYMGPGMNETQYAHNSYLQIMATWGAWTLVPLLLLLAAALRRRGEPPDGGGHAAQAAGIGFLAHNAVDFTLFLPGVALPAGLLLGLGAPPEPGEPDPAAPAPEGVATAPRRGRAGGFALASVALLLGAHAATSDRGAVHLDRARTLALAGETGAAEREARAAAAAFPIDPDPWAFTAQSLLARKASDPASAALRREAAERAVGLEPEAAILHHTLALDRAMAGDPAAAFVAERRAAQLFPAKELYRSPGERW